VPVTLGSKAPATGSTLAELLGAVTITGNGQTTLTLDDSGDTANPTGTLAAGSLTGFGTGGATFSGLASLAMVLGSGTAILTVTGTPFGVPVTLTAGAGSDAVAVDATSGPLTINAGTGPLSVYASSTAPTAGGTLAPIQGALSVNGNGATALTLDDSGDTAKATATITATAVTGLGMGSSGVTYSGLATLCVKLGTAANTLTVTGLEAATATTINGGGNAATTLTITTTGDLGGNLTVTGVPNASATVGGNFTGRFVTAGTLTSFAAQKGVGGLISAAAAGTISAKAGTGTLPLEVVDGGVLRQLEVTPVVAGTTPAPSFALFYQSTAAGSSVPTLAVQVTDASPSVLYNLALTAYNTSASGAAVAHSTAAKFDLSLLDSSSGASGLNDLRVEGDLVTTPTAQALGFLGASGTGGVKLPSDVLGSIAVRDYAAPGSITAKSVQVVAFGEFLKGGKVTPATSAGAGDASTLLVKGTDFAAAGGTFQATFGTSWTVALFFGKSDGTPDGNTVLLADEDPNAASDNSAVVATLTVVPAGKNPLEITALGLAGDYGSVSTNNQWVYAVTSSGPLGDLSLTSNQALYSVTAPSVYGSIDVPHAAITGTVQTTGVRTDPVTGLTTAVPATFGRIYTTTAGNTTTEQATFVHAANTISGQIISRGDLVSTVRADGGISGLVAAQGNLGAFDSANYRFGGMNVGGSGLTGQVVALGNFIGDVTINGGLKSGRIAAGGSIIGNMTIGGGLDANSVIVAAGSIGGSGTNLTLSGGINGIIAALGAITFKQTPPPSALVFQNVVSGTTQAAIEDAAAIDAVFELPGDQSITTFDQSPRDLANLNTLIGNLSRLRAVGTAPLYTLSDS
jgi:hypothetical protein